MPSLPAASTADHPTALWIGLPCTPDDANRLSVPDGEPVETLHCTLLMLDEDTLTATPEQVALLVGAVSTWSALVGEPITGSISGPGLFTEGPEPVTVALVDAPGLSTARELLATLVATTGLTVASDHGYTPHVTLAYDDVRDAVPSGPIGFPTVRLCVGGTVYEGLLGSPVTLAAPDIPDIPDTETVEVIKHGDKGRPGYRLLHPGTKDWVPPTVQAKTALQAHADASANHLRSGGHLGDMEDYLDVLADTRHGSLIDTATKQAATDPSLTDAQRNIIDIAATNRRRELDGAAIVDVPQKPTDADVTAAAAAPETTTEADGQEALKVDAPDLVMLHPDDPEPKPEKPYRPEDDANQIDIFDALGVDRPKPVPPTRPARPVRPESLGGPGSLFDTTDTPGPVRAPAPQSEEPSHTTRRDVDLLGTALASSPDTNDKASAENLLGEATAADERGDTASAAVYMWQLSNHPGLAAANKETSDYPKIARKRARLLAKDAGLSPVDAGSWPDPTPSATHDSAPDTVPDAGEQRVEIDTTPAVDDPEPPAAAAEPDREISEAAMDALADTLTDTPDPDVPLTEAGFAQATSTIEHWAGIGDETTAQEDLAGVWALTGDLMDQLDASLAAADWDRFNVDPDKPKIEALYERAAAAHDRVSARLETLGKDAPETPDVTEADRDTLGDTITGNPTPAAIPEPDPEPAPVDPAARLADERRLHDLDVQYAAIENNLVDARAKFKRNRSNQVMAKAAARSQNLDILQARIYQNQQTVDSSLANTPDHAENIAATDNRFWTTGTVTSRTLSGLPVEHQQWLLGEDPSSGNPAREQHADLFAYGIRFPGSVSWDELLDDAADQEFGQEYATLADLDTQRETLLAGPLADVRDAREAGQWTPPPAPQASLPTTRPTVNRIPTVRPTVNRIPTVRPTRTGLPVTRPTSLPEPDMDPAPTLHALRSVRTGLPTSRPAGLGPFAGADTDLVPAADPTLGETFDDYAARTAAAEARLAAIINRLEALTPAGDSKIAREAGVRARATAAQRAAQRKAGYRAEDTIAAIDNQISELQALIDLAESNGRGKGPYVDLLRGQIGALRAERDGREHGELVRQSNTDTRTRNDLLVDTNEQIAEIEHVLNNPGITDARRQSALDALAVWHQRRTVINRPGNPARNVREWDRRVGHPALRRIEREAAKAVMKAARLKVRRAA